MNAELLLILLILLAGSLPVLRWAFVGALLAIVIGLSDLFIRELIDLGGVPDYQRFDKRIDVIYLLTFLVVALRWRGTARSVAVSLFAYRLLGFAVFEFTDRRSLLFFPNIFEFWFLSVASLPYWRPQFAFTRPGTAVALVALTALKLVHEYGTARRTLVRWLHRHRGGTGDRGLAGVATELGARSERAVRIAAERTPR